MAPITPVVSPVCSTEEAMKDANWLDRGIFTPIVDPVYGELIVAQAQHKMTETPIRTKWVCRPVGYDNEYHLLKIFGDGTLQTKRDEKTRDDLKAMTTIYSQASIDRS